MKEIGFDGALMSGSGSCVFGLTRDDKILEKGFKYFKNIKRYRDITSISQDDESLGFLY